MSRADELSGTMRIEEEEKKRNELEGERFFAKEPIDPVQDLLWLSSRSKLHAEGPQNHGTQQSRGDPLAGDIGQNSHPLARTQLQEFVEIPAHIACGAV